MVDLGLVVNVVVDVVVIVVVVFVGCGGDKAWKALTWRQQLPNSSSGKRAACILVIVFVMVI